MNGAIRVAVAICGKEPTAGERCLEKIVDFFGIERRMLTPEQVALDGQGGNIMVSPYSVLISAPYLIGILKRMPSARFPDLFRLAESVFVFDFDSSAESRQLLRWLTGVPDADVGTQRPSVRRVSVTAGIPEMCGALSGVTAECSARDDGRGFLGVRACQGFRSLMSTVDSDVFFECQREGVRVFVSASGPSLDIDRPVDGSFFDVRHCFSSVVPLTIFLKGAFPGAVGSEQVARASLIVDDPVLKRRYGFLDFESVLTAMKRHDFCTTIAFIPWNWRRTNPRTAAIFLNNPERYSLVIHGCDHTSREFGASSLPALNHKVKTARQRADAHLHSTGIRVSPIMVFPQGVFSPEAVHVLKSNNFIAAVNTEVNAVGHATPGTPVREIWDVAIMKYSSFPIFTRRYMSHGLENVAFDAFLGKPCLLVAHHEVFKDDSRELTAFVDSLNSLAGGVRWDSLEQVITRSYISRANVDGTLSVRMFANELVLEHGSRVAGTVLVEKKESDREAIRSVTCDREEVDWTWLDGSVRFRVELPLLRAAVVKVQYADSLGESSSKEGTKYRIGVRARRYLSEVRDDYVCRNEFLNSYTGRVMRLLK